MYIPLGGSRCSKAKIIRNTFVIFLLSGFWHGANWTFIVWGAYHALLFLPLILLGRNRRFRDSVAEGRMLPNLKEVAQMALTFMLATVGWIIFRAENIGQAWNYLASIPTRSLFTIPWHSPLIRNLHLFAFIALMLAVEWIHRRQGYPLQLSKVKSRVLRYTLYLTILVIIVLFNTGTGNQFIYFQF